MHLIKTHAIKNAKLFWKKITPIKNVNVCFPWLSNSAYGNIYTPPPI